MEDGGIMALTSSGYRHDESYPTSLLKVDAVLVTAGVTAVVTGLTRLVQLAFSNEEISVYLRADPRHPLQWWIWYIALSMSVIVWAPYGLVVGLADLLVWARITGGWRSWFAEALVCIFCSALFGFNWWGWMREGESLTFVWQRVPALLIGAAAGVMGRRMFMRRRLGRARVSSRSLPPS